jgi:hypothetical protein
MRRRTLSTTLLVIAHVLIGVWAFRKMLEPDMMVNLLQMFSLC